CGTGHSFTGDGEYVFYADQRLWHPFPSDPLDPMKYAIATYEAIWTDHGAICLDEPRRLREAGPSVLDAIKLECGLKSPSCSAMLGNWWSFGYGVTANPKAMAPPMPWP